MGMVTPRIEVLEDGITYGKFVAEPLDQGFGYTLGNALRRVMLASIPGAAITSVKIEGVLHEFSTIPGVKEDTTELILNLRELYVKMEQGLGAEGEVYTLQIDVHGPGEVTGADIRTPRGIAVVNPEIHICSLSDETAMMKAELTCERGRGYVLPENQENVKKVIGIIPIGAVFTPVIQVSYTVDPTRVGHKTDYDRLVLEVTTNGTVRPSDVVSEAAAILGEQLALFSDFARAPKDSGAKFGDFGIGIVSDAPDVRIEELDFSVRTYNCLKKAGLLTIRDLVQLDESDLMNIRNFGKKSLTEVKEKLGSMNLALKSGGAIADDTVSDDGDDEDEVEEDGGPPEGSEEAVEHDHDASGES